METVKQNPIVTSYVWFEVGFAYIVKMWFFSYTGNIVFNLLSHTIASCPFLPLML